MKFIKALVMLFISQPSEHSLYDAISCSNAWWSRKQKSSYLPAISLEDKNFLQFLKDKKIYKVLVHLLRLFLKIVLIPTF